jgi:hypothetical protein
MATAASAGSGQLTGDRLGVGNHRRAEHPWAARPLAVGQGIDAFPTEPLAPRAHGGGRHPNLRAIWALARPAAAPSTILALVTWRC